MHFNIIFSSVPQFPKRFLCQHFPSTLLYSWVFLLDLVTITAFGEKYKYWSSSLYNFLYIPISSSLLVPNIPLSTPFSVQTMSLPNEYLMPLITCITDYTEISEINSTVGIDHNLHQVPLHYSVRPTAVVIEETLSVYLLVLLSPFS